MQILLKKFGVFSLEYHFKECIGTPVNIGLGFSLTPS